MILETSYVIADDIQHEMTYEDTFHMKYVFLCNFTWNSYETYPLEFNLPFHIKLHRKSLISYEISYEITGRNIQEISYAKDD